MRAAAGGGLAITFCFIGLVRRASADCEPHCSYPCGELNGPLNLECGDCTAASGFRCYPGAPDFDTWPERQPLQRQAVDAKGTQRVVSDDEDAPIELTHKSMVLRDKKFVLAMKKRTEAYGFDKYWAAPSTAPFLDFAPIAPAASPRHCEVHKCVLIEGDEPCAEGRAECEGPRGHLRSFGEQMDLQSIEEHHAALLPDAPYFWREHVAKYKPVLLRGAASKATNLSDWSDEALLSARDDADHLRCELKGGGRWWVTVEKNNRISHNDRFPLAEGYARCGGDCLQVHANAHDGASASPQV